MSLESAIREAVEGIVITSATGKIQYANPAFCKMTGYRLEEVIGHYPSILKSGSHVPEFYEELWKTILAGRVWRGEVINRRKDGTLYTEEMSITPVRSHTGMTTNYIAIKQDVTERRAAEAARQFLAAIVESTEDAVVGASLDGKILTWNRGAEKLHGFQTEEVLGRSIMMLLAPEYHDQCRRISEGLLRGRVFPRFKCVAMQKNGGGIDVSVSVSLIRGAEGEPTGLAAIIRDITKARQDEKVLRDNAVRFRSVFELAPFAVCITAPDYRILQVNEAFCLMLGYPAAELVALNWCNITHPDDRQLSIQAYDQLSRDPYTKVELQWRCIHKEGHSVSARISLSMIDFGGWYECLTHVVNGA